MNEIMISTVLCNILIGCFCVVVLSWAVVAIQTVINDFRREKREEKKSAQDDEYLTTNSADFHRHLGFEEVGRFHKCGYKFGRWYDMIWMEKIIGEHLPEQPPVSSCSDSR